jgi:hypothetical protein
MMSVATSSIINHHIDPYYFTLWDLDSVRDFVHTRICAFVLLATL